MARLIQSNSSGTNTSSVSTPAATQTVSSSVPAVVTPANTTQPKRRRYPRWFFPVLSIAILLTAGQVGYKAAIGGSNFLRNQGFQPSVKQTLNVAMPSSVWYAVSPQGDTYLVGNRAGDVANLELRKSSGELLWRRERVVDAPVFSQDGTQIFSGPEVLETATGKVIVRAPVPKSAYGTVWASQGSRVAWQNENDIAVWDRATNKTRILPLRGSSQVRISPNGKWLATVAYDEIYRGNVVLWDLTKSTKPELHPIGNPMGGTIGLTFSPDSRQLLYVGRGTVTNPIENRSWASIWALDSSQSTYEFYPEHSAESAVWSPDGKNFALRGREGWSVYNAASGELVWSGRHRTDSYLSDLYFTQDKKLYYYDYSKAGWSFEYWDLAKALQKNGRG